MLHLFAGVKDPAHPQSKAIREHISSTLELQYLSLEFVVCFCLTPHWDVTLGSYATPGLQYLTLELQYLSLEFVVCVGLTPHWDVTLGSYATLGLIYSNRPRPHPCPCPWNSAPVSQRVLWSGTHSSNNGSRKPCHPLFLLYTSESNRIHLGFILNLKPKPKL